MKMKKARRLISILMLLTIMVSVPATSVHAEGNVGRVGQRVGTISQAYTGGNSQVYANLITRADGTEVRYVYSKNYLCSNSPEDTFAALKSVLTADYAALIPDSVDASLNGSVGFFFCSDPSLEQYVNENWTSAEYVARNVLTIPEEGMSYSYKREENGAGGAVNTSATAARKNNRFEWIKTLAEAVYEEELDFGDLTGDDIQGTRDLTGSQIDLAVGCNLTIVPSFEQGGLVYLINIETIDHVASIYSDHVIISDSSSDDDEPTSEERRNLEYAKLHPYGQHTYVPSIVKDPTGETDGLMINVCRHCGYVERDSEQTISGYGVFNAKAVTAINNEAAGGTVQLETLRWISVHRKVLEALLAKPGVTFEVRYVYEGRKYVLRIDGSDPMLAILLQNREEDEYFGFPFLGTIFAAEEVQ